MQQPKSYVKRPVTVQAMQWTGNNLLAIRSFIYGHPIELRTAMCQDKWWDYENIIKEHGLIISTLEGPMKADIGDFIIKGIKGEVYPCKPDIFKDTYDENEV